MAEVPITEQILTDLPDEYNEAEAERLAKWVFSLLEHAAQARKRQTQEEAWAGRWTFLGGQQWEGPLPTYRRPIVLNIWRRALHMVIATLTGGRPLLKIVPQGANLPPPQILQLWQSALWALVKKEEVMRKYADALAWALVGDGGWLKIGYGTRGGIGDGDVLVTAEHPAKIFPDPDCTDASLTECGYIIYRNVLDLSTISRRYPEQGWRVTPDGAVSLRWPSEPPPWAKGAAGTPGGGFTIAPAGNWSVTGQFRRASATVVECWIDDPTLELVERKDIVNIDPLTGVPEVRTVKEWRPRYPYGRLITCTNRVVLRDIPNPYGEAFGWEWRWPFVYVSGAEQPHVLWRPGLLAQLEELQRSINKSLSLLIENAIKATNALVIADEMAMDDEEWDLLSLVPGAKIRKRQGTDVRVVFPQPLPSHAFQLPDYLARKLEEAVGIHDPPIAPGQAVAAKTVAFLMQKGSFLLGILAKLGEEALERLGQRMVGLMRARYLAGRPIPFFDGDQIVRMERWSEIPEALELRVEASSGLQELMAAMYQAAQAEAMARRRR